MAHLIEDELEKFVEHWNTHVMRANRLTGSPSAIPNDLYEMPNTYGTSLMIGVAFYFYYGIFRC